MEIEPEARQPEPKRISIDELRKNMRRVLADVEMNGATYVVTMYNKPAAILAPTIIGKEDEQQ